MLTTTAAAGGSVCVCVARYCETGRPLHNVVHNGKRLCNSPRTRCSTNARVHAHVIDRRSRGVVTDRRRTKENDEDEGRGGREGRSVAPGRGERAEDVGSGGK